MDTDRGTVEVARELGISLPRLLRFLSGRDDVVLRGSRRRLTPSAVAACLEHFGAIPRLDGLSRSGTQVLVALSRRPRGLVSVRQVAAVAGVSPTTATKAVARLMALGLVRARRTRLFDGKVVDRDVIEVDFTSASWRRVAPLLARAVLPSRPPPPPPPVLRLPPRLANVFWTGDWRSLDLEKSPSYAARRILGDGRTSPEALAFLGQLPPGAVADAIEQVASVAGASR